tara:strand:+ start:408 stop:1172 length:765 start_codon:yes stop_codon:yes gene_type:complete
MNKQYQDIVDNLTIMIIGPYDEQSLSNVENYKKICKNVLVFMWSDIQTEKVQKYLLQDNENVTVYTEKSPDRSALENAMFQHYETLLPQVKGIMLTTEKCQTKYALRTRSDESFSDLSPMIEKFSKNLDSVVSSNIVWRTKWTRRKKHMGDHTFITDTETLYKVYKDYYDSAFWGLRGTSLRKEFYNGEHHGTCEEHLYNFFMKHGRHPVPINVEKLGDYTVCVRGTKYTNREGLDPLISVVPDLLIGEEQSEK